MLTAAEQAGPVNDHAGLAHRERDEHTHDVELDQGADVGFENEHRHG